MTWDAYNRRKTALRDLLTLADHHPEIGLDELLDTVPGAREAFGDDDLTVLLDAQMLWMQRVRGQVDRLMGADDVAVEGSAVDDVPTPEGIAVQAWASAAAQMPGARALLDAARHRPELAKAFAKERHLVATAAGVPVLHPDLDGHGARLVAQARRAVPRQLPARRTVPHGGRHGIIARLREALAA